MSLDGSLRIESGAILVPKSVNTDRNAFKQSTQTLEMEEVQSNMLLLFETLAYIQAVSNNMIFVIRLWCATSPHPLPTLLLPICHFEAKSAPA